MPSYSFADTQCSITGPGGVINIGAGSGAADEGITIEMAEEKNTMTVGADGQVMHSLHASKAGRVTVRLLKTSPTNAVLQQMYNLQQASSANWGKNTITLANAALQDSVTAAQCAFRRQTGLTYSKDGNMNEWAWDSGAIDQVLGDGVSGS